jgi:hypothetical protein
MGLALVTSAIFVACGGGDSLTELQRVKAGGLDVVLLSPHGALRKGKDTFVIEFRKADGTLADVGDVHASAQMPMPGMGPMMGTVAVTRTDAGRYEAASDFSMAGTWRTTLEWSGPAGQGSVTFAGSVQ